LIQEFFVFSWVQAIQRRYSELSPLRHGQEFPQLDTRIAVDAGKLDCCCRPFSVIRSEILLAHFTTHIREGLNFLNCFPQFFDRNIFFST
jgi:hypothetical protein